MTQDGCVQNNCTMCDGEHRADDPKHTKITGNIVQMTPTMMGNIFQMTPNMYPGKFAGDDDHHTNCGHVLQDS